MTGDTRPEGEVVSAAAGSNHGARSDEFESLRPLLFSIAYRILGSVTDAEDAVQEAGLRYQTSPTQPESVRAFLSATVTRIAIDTLRSARVRRERYVGDWLPEPVVADPYADPERSAELADTLSMAALLLLERLSPAERAVFVLRDVFGFSFAEIADAVERSEVACRQLASRARQHMQQGRPRFLADHAARDALADRFFDALRAGDVGGVRELLTADAHLVGDAGGNAPQWSEHVYGPDRVARLLAATVQALQRIGVTITRQRVNGQPGAILRDRDGQVFSAFTLDILDGGVQTLRSVINPDKLGHLGPVADPWAVVQQAKQARDRDTTARDVSAPVRG